MSENYRVPSRTWADPVLSSMMHTGADAVAAIIKLCETVAPYSVDVAIDTETPGLDEPFTMNCLTASWVGADNTRHTVLLDPDRTPGDDTAAHALVRCARTLILHNAAFDVPGLLHNGVIDLDDTARIVDTLVLARMRWPDSFVRKNLEALAKRLLGLDDFGGGMDLAFHANGYKNREQGFKMLDIHSPIYRQGAMADTAATLQIEPVLRDQLRDMLTDHPFSDFGASTRAEADEIIGVTEQVSRVMLRRVAKGIAVDRAYLERYSSEVEVTRARHAQQLQQVGLEGGTGKGTKLIEYLASIDELPEDWPRTKTGKLSATKDLIESLDHPLASAQRSMAFTEKVLGYLDKVDHQASVTGRCHPQISVLGASTTGRMSYSRPELQQFPADARPILVADESETLWSIDWSQIEPVTMANMARDEEFLAPFEQGEDLYEPIMRAAGIDRPLAKAMLLATMYGQGVRSLAARTGHTEESAAQIRRQMLSAMRRSGQLMSKTSAIAAEHGMIVTLGGRILPVDSGGTYRAVNYLCQGSAYDVLAQTICDVDDAGLSDHIVLAMHDELVIQGDEETAAEVERMMQTPPERLVRWSGRTPVLRTDRQCMDSTWLKV